MSPTTQPRASTDSDRNALLFVCEANSARSQMAEGFARFLAPANFTIYSAGSLPGRLNPFAVRAMKEVGIDISHQIPKSLADVPIKRVATIITLCSSEECPDLPSDVLHVHCPLPDPAAVMSTDDDALEAFRAVRDSIRELVSRIF